MTALSADRPSSNPQDDLFGHAPFAESLAISICRYPGNDGLVSALYGLWCSGKSTVLSNVRHFLDQRPKTEQPFIVTFNPWWFSRQENLARAFLGQLQALIDLRQAGVVPGTACEAVDQFLKSSRCSRLERIRMTMMHLMIDGEHI